MCCLRSVNSLAGIIDEMKKEVKDEEFIVVVRRSNVLEDAMKPSQPIIPNKTMVVCYIEC